MTTLTLSAGTIAYRALGPEAASSPPVVFVHGALVDSRLWDGVAERLAADGVRCYLPDLPLGSHKTAMTPGSDRTPRGVANLVNEFLAQLGLDDVTLVGNDSGGAICQFLLDTDPSRIGRLLLTNCDAFTNFPPFPFNVIFRLARSPAGARVLLAPMRLRAVRHSPAGFGMLARRFDPALTRDWLEPALTSAGIREDFAALVRGIDPPDLDRVSNRMNRFEQPARIVWGEADRLFKPKFGRRLAEIFPDATYVGVEGARTFLPLDDPARVAEEIQRLRKGST